MSAVHLRRTTERKWLGHHALLRQQRALAKDGEDWFDEGLLGHRANAQPAVGRKGQGRSPFPEAADALPDKSFEDPRVSDQIVETCCLDGSLAQFSWCAVAKFCSGEEPSSALSLVHTM